MIFVTIMENAAWITSIKSKSASVTKGKPICFCKSIVFFSHYGENCSKLNDASISILVSLGLVLLMVGARSE